MYKRQLTINEYFQAGWEKFDSELAAGTNAVLQQVATNNTEEKAAESKYNMHPLVWAYPKEMVYHSKKRAKIVRNIPFTLIHNELSDSRWSISAKRYERGINDITMHIGFVVSNLKQRSFVELPIDSALASSAIEILRTAGKRKHSEHAIRAFLTSNRHVTVIAKRLKEKLNTEYGNESAHKVHAVIIYLNSRLNPCNKDEPGANCEQVLHELQDLQTPGSFLHLFKTEISKLNIKSPTRSNNGFPRVLISVSSTDQYVDGCSDRHRNASKYDTARMSYTENLQRAYKDRYEGRIDCKQLSGKAIINTKEKHLNGEEFFKNYPTEIEAKVKSKKRKHIVFRNC